MLTRAQKTALKQALAESFPQEKVAGNFDIEKGVLQALTRALVDARDRNRINMALEPEGKEVQTLLRAVARKISQMNERWEDDMIESEQDAQSDRWYGRR